MGFNFGDDPGLTSWLRGARALLWLDGALVIFNALLVFVSGLLNTDTTQVSFNIGPFTAATGSTLTLLAITTLIVGALFVWLPFLLTPPSPTRRYTIAALAVVLLVVPFSMSQGWLVVGIAVVAVVILIAEPIFGGDTRGTTATAAAETTPPSLPATPASAPSAAEMPPTDVSTAPSEPDSAPE